VRYGKDLLISNYIQTIYLRTHVNP